jgi:hypothetical protein
MTIRDLLTTALALLLFCAPAQLYAGATVFVPEDADEAAWEVRTLAFIPKKKSDGGVSIEQVNLYLAKNRGMRVETQICFMDFARVGDIVSSNRKTQIEIDTNLAEYPNSFAEFYEPEPGRKFLARVGIFQECDERGTAFMALVVTDQMGSIREFDALTWNFIRLFKRDDGKINVFGCFACGEIQELAWDKLNDRFYYVWNGH